MAARLPVVVVGGWGMPAALVDGCLPRDRERHRITPEQLLETGMEDPEEAIARQFEILPEKAIWIGWSLGGQLAMAAQARMPGRVAAVFTLCASARFMAADDWPSAVAPRLLDDFRRRLARSPNGTLTHFCSLMVHGADRAGEERRWLRRTQWPQTPEQWRLEHTLDWLGRLDQRDLWRDPPGLSRHLFGGRDALVPPDVATNLGLVRERWQLVPGMAHWPGGHFADSTRGILEQWCDQVME